MREGAPRKAALVSDLVSIAAVAMSLVGVAISLAVLIFVGSAEPALPRAVSSFVFGGAIACGFIGWRSRVPTVISGAQDTAAVVMVAVAASVAAQPSPDPALDVVVLIAVTSLITGLVMVLLGRLRLSSVARYLPTTVVSAFIAGTGWLLFKGGMDIMTSVKLGLGDIGDLFKPELLKFWIPGLMLGLLTLLVGRSKTLPTSLASLGVIVAIGGFFAVTAALSSLGAVEDGGWLIGPFPGSEGLQLVMPADIGDTTWSSILGAAPGIASIVLVSVVGLLLNLSGFELIERQRIDLDAELQTAGLANIFIAPFGGLVSYHLLGTSGLAKSLGARSRVVAVGAAVVGVVVALAGTKLVGYLPRFVPGGLLAGVGLALLVAWVTSLPLVASKIERALSVLIVSAIAGVGILEGIAIGIVAACAIFVVRYSKIDPVRLELTGNEIASRVDRGRAATAALARNGDQVAIYALQGYLFFGTTSSMAARVASRCIKADPALSAVILDFRHVTGLDHSALALLRRLSDEVSDAGVEMMWSGLGETFRSTTEGTSFALLNTVRVFENLDEALEAAEELVLVTEGAVGNDPAAHRSEIDLSPELVEMFDACTVPAGAQILTQGDPSDAVYFLVRGSLTAWHRPERGVPSRVRRFTSLSVVGEIGFVSGNQRTADVVADSEVQLLVLTRSAYGHLRTSKPELALELHDYLLAHIAQRIAATNISLGAALR